MTDESTTATPESVAATPEAVAATPEAVAATPEAVAAIPDVPAVETIPVEARPYQGQRAGIVTRVIANIIDLGIVVVVLVSAYATVAATMFVLDPRSFTMPSAPPLVTIILIGMWVQGVYFTLTWCTTGRTYGDHLMGLRVVNYRGRRMSFIGASLRAALCVVFPVGLFWIVVSHGNRSVQDVAFRTSVIHDWKPHHTD